MVKTMNEAELKIIGYRSKINITQVLPCEKEDLTRSHENKIKKLMDTSWLYDPFGDYLTYLN